MKKEMKSLHEKFDKYTKTREWLEESQLDAFLSQSEEMVEWRQERVSEVKSLPGN